MPQGQSVLEVVQWIIVWLRTVMTCWDIAMYTDLSELEVCEILAYAWQEFSTDLTPYTSRNGSKLQKARNMKTFALSRFQFHPTSRPNDKK